MGQGLETVFVEQLEPICFRFALLVSLVSDQTGEYNGESI